MEKFLILFVYTESRKVQESPGMKSVFINKPELPRGRHQIRPVFSSPPTTKEWWVGSPSSSKLGFDRNSRWKRINASLYYCATCMTKGRESDRGMRCRVRNLIRTYRERTTPGPPRCFIILFMEIYQRGTLAGYIQVFKSHIYPFWTLGLPSSLSNLIDLRAGRERVWRFLEGLAPLPHPLYFGPN